MNSLPAPRAARPGDAPELARLHAQAWAETYTGLLPEGEIAAMTETRRRAQWTQALAMEETRIALIPGAGFAQMGPQRDARLVTLGYDEELYALYLLQAAQGQGLGQALWAAVQSDPPVSCSALVVAGNARAGAFYLHQGARLLEARPERIGQAAIVEQVYVWDRPKAPGRRGR